MKNKILFQRLSLGVVCILLVLLISVQQSCKKTDFFDQQNAGKGEEIARLFFTMPPGSNPSLLRVAAELKEKYKGNELTNLALNDGFPIWNKALIKTKNNQPDLFQRDGQQADTLIILPLVVENSNIVTAYFTIHLYGNADVICIGVKITGIIVLKTQLQKFLRLIWLLCRL